MSASYFFVVGSWLVCRFAFAGFGCGVFVLWFWVSGFWEFAFDLFGGWVWRLLGVLLVCMVCTAFTDLFAGCGFCGLRILWVLGFAGRIST